MLNGSGLWSFDKKGPPTQSFGKLSHSFNAAVLYICIRKRRNCRKNVRQSLWKGIFEMEREDKSHIKYLFAHQEWSLNMFSLSDSDEYLQSEVYIRSSSAWISVSWGFLIIYFTFFFIIVGWLYNMQSQFQQLECISLIFLWVLCSKQAHNYTYKLKCKTHPNK